MDSMDLALWAIIRPRRRIYSLSDFPRSIRSGDTEIGTRIPLNFKNSRDQKIVGSFYIPTEQEDTVDIPCIMFLHGNASCQVEGQFLVHNLLPMGLSVCLFDFSGSGLSDGQFVSLGFFESLDTLELIDHIRQQYNVGKIVLWGRSMGAATALLVNHPAIVGKIVDSPYSSVRKLCQTIARVHSLSKFANKFAMWMIKRKVSQNAHYNIDDVRPIANVVKQGQPPMLIAHSEHDTLIDLDQAMRIFECYAGNDKEFITLEGSHGGPRTKPWLNAGFQKIFKWMNVSSDCFKYSENHLIISTNEHFDTSEQMIKASHKTSFEKGDSESS